MKCVLQVLRIPSSFNFSFYAIAHCNRKVEYASAKHLVSASFRFFCIMSSFQWTKNNNQVKLILGNVEIFQQCTKMICHWTIIINHTEHKKTSQQSSTAQYTRRWMCGCFIQDTQVIICFTMACQTNHGCLGFGITIMQPYLQWCSVGFPWLSCSEEF